MQLETIIEFASWVESAPPGIFRRSEQNLNLPNFVKIIEFNSHININIEKNLELSNNGNMEVARFRQIIHAIHDEVVGTYQIKKKFNQEAPKSEEDEAFAVKMAQATVDALNKIK